MNVEAMGITKGVGVYARKSVGGWQIRYCLRENQKMVVSLFVPDMFTRFCILLLQSLLSLGRCPIAT